MAISHSLDIQTSLSTREIKNLLLNSQLNLTQSTIENNLAGFGILISITEMGEYGKLTTKDEYGFVPDVSISFWMDLSESQTEGVKITEKTCAILLAKIAGDALFFFNSDNLTFKRINGKLTIYDDWTEYLMSELDKLGIKYEVKKSEYAEI